jgi:GNAT superfamily N-acetyltransferase
MTALLADSPTVNTSTVLVDTVGPDARGEVYLQLLAVAAEHRGTGVGTAALHDLCDRADVARWTVRLNATCDLDADVVRLVRWYARAGFVLDRKVTAMWPYLVPMVRFPR